jgi:restriction system protein
MATLGDVPKYDAMMMPLLRVLKRRGGSATNDELVEQVAAEMRLPEDIREVMSENGARTEFAYRLAWARTYLKKAGAITNSERGVWSLTEIGDRLGETDIPAIKRSVQSQGAERRRAAVSDKPPSAAAPDDEADLDIAWTERLLNVLGEMKPDAFERLCQRVLRESGFISVEVTGRAGDGGIDGIGVLRMNLVSFHVLFQCKRWKGSVGSSVIRDFRGAMVGRADKGLVISTGTFTADAAREARRDGAPAIDLIDGETLCGLLKQLGLGISVRMVEEVAIEPSFFAAI